MPPKLWKYYHIRKQRSLSAYAEIFGSIGLIIWQYAGAENIVNYLFLFRAPIAEKYGTNYCLSSECYLVLLHSHTSGKGRFPPVYPPLLWGISTVDELPCIYHELNTAIHRLIMRNQMHVAVNVLV